MPARFDWKAEDEKERGGLVPETPQGSGGQWPSRRLKRAVVVLALMAIVSLIAVNQIGRFVDSSTSETEQDVLNGHELVLEAAFNKDGDLLGGLIFDRFQEWTAAQKLITEQGLLLDRSFLDLYLAEDVGPVDTKVEIDPQLRQAIVTMTLPYQVGADELRPDVIELRYTFSYRNDDDRWLLNPPTAEFWGPWISTRGRYLTLSYPQHDGQLGQRLAADLEAAIGRACNAVEALNCQNDLHLDVNLVADPTALLEMSDPVWRLFGGSNIDLPTLTLIGLPVDEAAYRVVFHAYADRIVTRLIAQQTGITQTGQPLLAAVISDRIVDQLGLRAWPKTGEEVASSTQALNGQAMYREVQALWNRKMSPASQSSESSTQTFAALVNFLVNDWSDVPEGEMLRLLASAETLEEWLLLLNPNASDAMFIAAWDSYITEALLVHPAM